MKKLFKAKLYVLALLLISVNTLLGQSTITWNFGTSTGSATPNPVSVTNLSISDLSIGNPYGSFTMLNNGSPSSGYTGASGDFNAGHVAQTGVLPWERAYYEFTLTPEPGSTLILSSISFGTKSEGTGPQAYLIRTSQNDYETDIASGSITPAGWQLKSHTLNFTGASEGTPVTFRIYGTDGAGEVIPGMINWRIDDLVIQAGVIPSIVLNSSNPSVPAGSITAGVQKALLYKYNTTVTNSNTVLNSVTFNTAGTYTSSDLSKFQLWYKAGSDDFATAVQIGSDITSSLGTGQHTFSSLSQEINAGTTGYYYITVDFLITGVPGNTININALTTSGILYSFGVKSGTAYDGGIQTISAPITPNVVLSSTNPAVPSGNLLRSSEKNVIYKFSTAITASYATLTGVSFTTAGTYEETDISKFQLWYNTTDNLPSATQIGSDITLTLGAGSHTFTGLNQIINENSTGYFYITTNVNSGAIPLRNMKVSAITTGDLTYQLANKSGAAYEGGIQTILKPQFVVSSSNPAVPNAQMIRSSNKNVIYRLMITGTSGSASLENFTFSTAGTYQAADMSKFQLFYSTTDDINGAAQLGNDITLDLGTGSHTTLFSPILINNETIYIWITADVSSTASPGNVLYVPAMLPEYFVFDFADVTSTSFNGGNQTIATPTFLLSSSNPSVPAATLSQGTQTNIIYKFSLASNGTGRTNLTQLNFNTTGTYAASGDVTEFQLYFNTSDNFNTANRIKVINTSLGTGAHSFTGLSRNITNNSTVYFWICADIGSSAVSGNTLTVSAITNSDITFDGGTTTGTAYNGGTQTISTIISFKSVATGNWNSPATWNISIDLNNWMPAPFPPGATNPVYIENGRNVTLTGDASCLDLHLNGNLALSTYTLDVNGKLRFYSGSAPGTSSTSVGSSALTSSTGKLRFTGTTRTILKTGEWGNNPQNWNVEFAPSSGNTFTIETGFKAKAIEVSSGTVISTNADFRPDGGSAGTGTLSVKSGATLKFTNSVQLKRIGTASSTSHFGTLTVENGGTLEFSGTSATIGASVLNFDGTVIYSLTGDQTLAVKGSNSAATDPGVYTNLVFSGSGSKSLAVNTTINGTLTYGGTASLNLNGKTLNYGSSATLDFSGSNSQTLSNTGIPNNITINNPSGVTLNENVTINGNLNMNSGLLNVGSRTLTVNGDITYSKSTTNMIVLDDGVNQGTLVKSVSATGVDYVLPVGDSRNTSQYAPVTIRFNPGTSFSSASLTLQMFNNKYSGNGSLNDYLNRYWAITSTGITGLNYDITLQYNAGTPDAGDVTGNEDNIYFGKYDGSSWVEIGKANTTTHRLSATGLTGFSTFTGGEQSAMPVTLSSFTSNLNVRDVKLRWTTENELNNSGFEVERAEVRSKNLEFIKIGYVSGQGTKNTPTSYALDDRKLETGKYIYRLKQIDNNGNFEYFVLNGEIEIGVPQKFELSQNYPNPFNPATKIDFSLPLDSRVNIVLYDITGREVKTLVNDSRKAGYYTVQFNASDLSSGTYFYRIMTKSSGQDFVMTKKMMLVK